MKRTTRSIALEVCPHRRVALGRLIDRLRGSGPNALRGQPNHYAALLAAMPTLHFFSMVVFDSDDYDPLLVIEANFDGKPGPFWAQLQAALGDDLRQILCCCKRPRDGAGDLYDLVTDASFRRDPAPYLELRAKRPRAYFHGTRGMSRERILAEAALARAIQEELGDGGKWRGRDPESIRLALRGALVPNFPWLAEHPPKRVPPGERLLDWLKLGLLIFAILHALCIPGIVIGEILSDNHRVHALLLANAALIAWSVLKLKRAALPEVGTGKQKTLPRLARINGIKIVLFIVALFVLSWPIVAGVSRIVLVENWADAWDKAALLIAWGIAWMLLFELPAALVWLRYLERHDSSLEQPRTDPAKLRRLDRIEDWIPQNHMASLVPMRPQVPRRVLAFVGPLAAHLALRAMVLDGYLGSMRTIHFAHWTPANNDSRMLFLSNYDLSWESYFDDFIEKAHEGVTLFWGGCVGFPPTTMLVEDGAAHGRMFKRWARHSMAVTSYWISAYPNLTVDQIHRNNRIADGMRARRLSPKRAATWIAEL